MKIGLALSGGGYRATVFHLGVLASLAERRLLEQIDFVSSVSGGSLAAGLVFRANNYQWPSSKDYLEIVVPFSRKLLTSTDLQLGVFVDAISKFVILPSRAGIVSRRLRRDWGIDIPLQDLPEHPRWIINAVSVETGRNWRFERKRMGDYLAGYCMDPNYLLSDAMAASAGYPILIGAMVLYVDNHHWVRYKLGSRSETEPIKPMFSKIHLWDGGLYDNLGVEPLINYRGEDQGFGYRDGVDYLIVSNASGDFPMQKYALSYKTLMRLITIPLYQSQALRSRDIIHRFQEHGFKGLYFMLGNSAKYILGNADISDQDTEEQVANSLSEEAVRKANQYDTNIRQLSTDDFDLLYQHGYETGKYTAMAYAK